MGKKIYHRNDIRPVIANMSLSARRILYICLSELERQGDKDKLKIEFDSEKIFTISVKEYAELCCIDYSAAYRQLSSGALDLMTTAVEVSSSFLGDTDKPSDYIKPFQVAVYGTGYSKGGGYVDVKLAEQLRPFLSSFTQNFTGQLLHSAISLPDTNASKLYLILREWISANKWNKEIIITIDDFRQLLGVNEIKTYSIFNNFNNKFFKPSVSKLIEKTEFSYISMEINERKGRKAHKVKISWEFDEQELQNNNNDIEIRLDKISKSMAENAEKLIEINGRFYTEEQAKLLK